MPTSNHWLQSLVFDYWLTTWVGLAARSYINDGMVGLQQIADLFAVRCSQCFNNKTTPQW